MPYSLVEDTKVSEEPAASIFKVYFFIENGDSWFIRIVGTYVPNYTASTSMFVQW
jgi:hypothetical protein